MLVPIAYRIHRLVQQATLQVATHAAPIQLPQATVLIAAVATQLPLVPLFKNGKITAVTTKNSYSDHESGRYVDSFESSFSSDATGESLASYSPSRIGGASLTTHAFADVLDQIRSDAAA